MFMKQLITKILHKVYHRLFSWRISTSLSDNEGYPQVCVSASIDNKIFNNFRRNIIYTQILEHVSQKQGKQYLDLILDDKEILDSFEEYKLNDRFGNPKKYNYPKIGEISPSTLRYIKVLSDLKKYFGSLDDYNMCEIGVGYGGQCRIINVNFSPSSYTLVDIKAALSLAQRFLDNYIINSVLAFTTMNELFSKEYDLVLSNYAFTELPRNIQDVYLKKVILNSKRGYITYNDINPSYFNSYKAQELIKIIPGSEIFEEEPLTHQNNCLIIWGHGN